MSPESPGRLPGTKYRNLSAHRAQDPLSKCCLGKTPTDLRPPIEWVTQGIPVPKPAPQRGWGFKEAPDHPQDAILISVKLPLCQPR